MRPWDAFSAREADDFDYDGLADALKPDRDLVNRNRWRQDFKARYGADLDDGALDQHADLAAIVLGQHPSIAKLHNVASQQVPAGRQSTISNHTTSAAAWSPARASGAQYELHRFRPPPIEFDGESSQFILPETPIRWDEHLHYLPSTPSAEHLGEDASDHYLYGRHLAGGGGRPQARPTFQVIEPWRDTPRVRGSTSEPEFRQLRLEWPEMHHRLLFGHTFSAAEYYQLREHLREIWPYHPLSRQQYFQTPTYRPSQREVDEVVASIARVHGVARPSPSEEPVRVPFRTVDFLGKRVYQRGDLFDPLQRDYQGRTNIERMLENLSPLSRDYRPIDLHHVGQRNEGPYLEIFQRAHQGRTRDLHTNPRSVPTQIIPGEASSFRYNYWPARGRELEGESR